MRHKPAADDGDGDASPRDVEDTTADAPSQPTGEVTVDARDQPCPMPVIALARAAATAQAGTEIVVLATDPAADADIAAWCRMRGHRLLGAAPVDPDGPAAAPVTAYRVRTSG